MEHSDPKAKSAKLHPIHDQSSDTTDRDQTAGEATFHKDLVKFAIIFTLLCVPLALSFDVLMHGLSAIFDRFMLPVEPDRGTSANHPFDATVTLSVVIAAIFFVGVLAFMAVRSIKPRAAPAPEPADVAALRRELSEKNNQIERLNSRIEQQMLHLRKIQARMYQDSVRPRHDFISFDGLYIVNENGDIDVTKEIVLTSTELDVHFWRFYANGEDAADPLDDVAELQLEVKAIDDERTEVLPLLIEDRPTRKAFTANFLPAIVAGEQRGFIVKYRWPGFLRELIDRGSTRYFWDSRAYTTGALATFRVEWRFHRNLGEISCENMGANPSGMSLMRERTLNNTIWRYWGTEAPLGNIPLELQFSRGNKELF